MPYPSEVQTRPSHPYQMNTLPPQVRKVLNPHQPFLSTNSVQQENRRVQQASYTRTQSGTQNEAGMQPPVYTNRGGNLVNMENTGNSSPNLAALPITDQTTPYPSRPVLTQPQATGVPQVSLRTVRWKIPSLTISVASAVCMAKCSRVAPQKPHNQTCQPPR
jgi:hypothetical protein